MRTSLLFAMLLCTGLLACGDDTSSGPDTDDTMMTAKVDGRSLSMSSISYDWLGVRYFVSGSTDLMPPNENIMIEFDSITTTGTFTITGTTGNVTASYEKRSGSSGGDVEYAATAGTVTVTEFDASHAKGTFSFQATEVGGSRTVTVTEGVFSTVAIN